MKAIYTNWTTESGAFLFPTVEPGSENGWPGTINGIPFGVARKSSGTSGFDSLANPFFTADYFAYQVLNMTSIKCVRRLLGDPYCSILKSKFP